MKYKIQNMENTKKYENAEVERRVASSGIQSPMQKSGRFLPMSALADILLLIAIFLNQSEYLSEWHTSSAIFQAS